MTIKDRFEKDKQTLIDGCIDIIPDIDGIILYGSYGRGEGTWIKSNSGFEPYNDYDLVIVSNSRIDKKRIKTLRIELAKKIGISWVDISVYSHQKLKKLKPSIFNYDLKNGSTVIFGDNKILHNIPSFSPSEIPLKDIRILFYTRLFTLIGSYKSGALEKGITDRTEVMFYKNQLAKAVLAAVDCLLLLKGAYDSSYRCRVNKVSTLYTLNEDIEGLNQWALKEKFEPTGECISAENATSLYKQVVNYFMDTMIEGLECYYGTKVFDAKSITKKYNRETSILIYRLFYFLKRNAYFESVIRANEAQVQFIFANIYCKYHDNKQLNYLFEKYKIDKGLSLEAGYEELRLKIASMRLAL